MILLPGIFKVGRLAKPVIPPFILDLVAQSPGNILSESCVMRITMVGKSFKM